MKTTPAKPTRLGLSQELGELMQLVALRSAEQLAALLRNPGESYPSGGLIRTYLLQRQDAPSRFVDLVRVRRQEVESQLANGIQALQITDRARKVFLVEPKQHIITILEESELANVKLRTVDDVCVVLSAGLTVPRDWIKECTICRRYFVSPWPRSQVCARVENGKMACRQEAARRRRRERRQVQRQDVNTAENTVADEALEGYVVI